VDFRFVIIGMSVAGLLTALLVGQAWGPVGRARLEKFARRQRLRITPANGELVIRYLAHTRRWRIAGVLAGIGIVAAIGLAGSRLEGAALFAGWFVGAVIAETRLAAGPSGARRVASLAPRTFHRYVGRFTWYLLPMTAVAAVAVAIIAVPRGRAFLQVATALLAVGITVAVMLTRSRIVARAQPYEQPALIAADDALRSRALHVLSGGGIALVLICVGTQCDLLASISSASGDSTAGVVSTAVTYVGAWTGWMIGASRVLDRPAARLTLAA
jgi:hypothetical protein